MNIGTNAGNMSDFKGSKFEDLKFRNPDKFTKRILGFLTAQSETAEKQFKTSRNLIRYTIIIMILQTVITIYDIYKSHSKQNNLNTIIELQSKQSEAILRMSLNLLDLQTQVRTLEQKNALLDQKLKD